MTGYAEAQKIYLAQRWRGVLPLPARSKFPPPDGFTGKDGGWPNDIDLAIWAEQYGDGNTCLRLPDDVMVGDRAWRVIGIDADGYDGKSGLQTLAEGEKRWGPLPPTYRSSSRDDGSCIRLYRIPAGIKLRGVLKFRELGIGDVELIQHHHRYMVVWPSIHPEGRLYLWFDEIRGVVMSSPPGPDDLPELPDAWIEGLRADTPCNYKSAAGHDKKTTKTKRKEVYNVTAAMTAGRPSQKVFARLGEALYDLAEGLSRHDTTLGHVMALLRFGRNGEPGVGAALELLYRCFVDTVGPDRKDGEPEAEFEFERMVTNAEPLLADTPPPASKRVQWGAGRRLW